MRPFHPSILHFLALAYLPYAQAGAPLGKSHPVDRFPEPLRSIEKLVAAEAKRARKGKKLAEAAKKGAIRGKKADLVILDDVVDLTSRPDMTATVTYQVSTCKDCAHWARCKGLIQDLTVDETECDFSPSRFYPRK